MPGLVNGREDVCCSTACAQCGGPGCGAAGEGVGPDNCCEGPILEAGEFCDVTGAAPCILGCEFSRCRQRSLGRKYWVALGRDVVHVAQAVAFHRLPFSSPKLWGRAKDRSVFRLCVVRTIARCRLLSSPHVFADALPMLLLLSLQPRWLTLPRLPSNRSHRSQNLVRSVCTGSLTYVAWQRVVPAKVPLLYTLMNQMMNVLYEVLHGFYACACALNIGTYRPQPACSVVQADGCLKPRCLLLLLVLTTTRCWYVRHCKY